MSFPEPRNPLILGMRLHIPEVAQPVECPMISIRQRRQSPEIIKKIATLRTRALELAKDPAATFETVQTLQDEVIDASLAILRLALERNYPGITEDDIDTLSPSQLNDAVGYVLSGERPQQGEVKAPSKMDEAFPFPNGARPMAIMQKPTGTTSSAS